MRRRLLEERLKLEVMQKKILFIIGIILISLSFSYADKFTAVQNGDWTTGSTWDNGSVPGQNDTAIIPDNITVNIPRSGFFGFSGTTARINKLIVEKGGELTITNGLLGLSKLYVGDSLIVDGKVDGDVNSSYPAQVYLGNVLTGTGTIKYIALITNNSKIQISPDANLTLYISPIWIQDDDTIENYGKITTDQWIRAYNSNSTWINKEDSYLSVGDILVPAGKLICNEPNNTIMYAPVYRNVPITIPIDSTYYNLYFGGSDTSNTDTSIIYVNNDFKILASVFKAHKSKIYLKGNWYDDGSFIADTADVFFDGDKSQSIHASAYETYFNLYLENSPDSVILNSDIQITDTLTLNTVVNGLTHNVTIGSDTSNTGTIIYKSGKIIGKMSRWTNSTILDYSFPIGCNEFNTFANIKFSKIDTAGLISFKFIKTFPGSDGLPLTDNDGRKFYNVFGDGYWVADTSRGFRLGKNTYTLNLQGDKFTSFDINDSTRIVVRPDVDSLWRFNGVYGSNNVATYTVIRQNLDTFPFQFAFADTTNCTPPTLTAINGPTDVCRGETGVVYTTDTSSTNTFYWTVSGGTIDKNNGDTITINWDNDGQVATISVYAQNACTFGNTISKTVNVNSIPPSELYGMKAVPEQSDSIMYYIDPRDNYTYNYYTSSNAKIDSVYSSHDTILVSFTTPGTDTIYVVAQAPGNCPSDTAQFPILVYEVINSVQSGDWYDPSTWDCNCQPLVSDNVRIRPGHTVTIKQYTDPRTYLTYKYYDINNVDVEKGGILKIGDAQLYIHGDVINNGQIDFTDNNLYLEDANKTIDGLGTFIADTVQIQGTRNISPTASLTFNSNVNIYGNLLYNSGNVLITKDLVGNTDGTFVNNDNAVLSIKGQLLDGAGELIADSTDNTITYAGGDQNVTPVSSSSDGYYNLSLGGSGSKTATGDLTVLGNFIIKDTASFDINSHNITLYGNWYEYSTASDPFIEGTSQVLFNADGDQYIYAENGETFYDLKIGQNSTLHAFPKQHFTVTNDFYLDGLLKLEMNHYNDTLPSFIYDNDIIYGTNGAVETDLKINAKHWHEVSPAIQGITSATFTRNIPNIFNANLYWYDESMDLDNDPSTSPGDGSFDSKYLSYAWKFAHNGASGSDINLNLNEGYLYYVDRDMNIAMKGKVAPVTVNFDTTLSYHDNDPISDTLPYLYDGWNFVGNPYTAYLSVDSLTKNATNMDNGVYVWDDANGQYAGYQNGYRIGSGNLGNLIPPLQGFFVRANNTNAVLKIRPQYRTHGQQQYLKKSAPLLSFKQNAIKIGFCANNRVEYFAAYFYPLAKNTYDSKYDLIHLATNVPQNPQLFGKKHGYNLALYSLPDSMIGKAVIPLYLKTSISGTHTLKIKYIKGLYNSFVLLHDLKNGTFYNLRQDRSISFDYSPSDDSHRFDLMIVKDNPPTVKDTIPKLIAYEDSTFSFDLSGYFTDKDMFDSLTLMVNNLPDWLTLKGKTLSGTPAQKDVGIYRLTVTAYDIFNKSAAQTITLEVLNTNDPPKLNHKLNDTIISAFEVFNYTLPHDLFSDPDPNDSLTISAQNLPGWLTFNQKTNNFYGVPTNADVGTYDIQVTATDRDSASVSTSFNITVMENGSTNVNPLAGKSIKIYPVPAHNDLNIRIPQIDSETEIQIYSLSGQLINKIKPKSDITKIDISRLPAGQYLIEIHTTKQKYSFKITKY